MSTDELPVAKVRAPAADLSEMALTLHDEPSFHSTAQRVLDYALVSVQCLHAGIIFVQRGKRVETVVATDPVVASLDRVQFEVGQGPDLQILDGEGPVVIDDTLTDSRWPRWSAMVADAGIRSMMGVRLHTTASTVGSLNFYAAEPGHFSAEDRTFAQMLAKHAAVALASARESESLWQAIEARHVVGQAQGILMERFDVDADTAFAILRRYSQARNQKLRELAAEFIETRDLPDLPGEVAPA